MSRPSTPEVQAWASSQRDGSKSVTLGSPPGLSEIWAWQSVPGLTSPNWDEPGAGRVGGSPDIGGADDVAVTLRAEAQMRGAAQAVPSTSRANIPNLPIYAPTCCRSETCEQSLPPPSKASAWPPPVRHHIHKARFRVHETPPAQAGRGRGWCR